MNKQIEKDLLKTLLGVDKSALGGDSTAIWQTPDWGSLERNAWDRYTCT